MLSQLGQCLSFDLTDTFTGDSKFLPDFFECMTFAILKTKAHLDNLLLTLTEGRKYRLNLLAQ